MDKIDKEFLKIEKKWLNLQKNTKNNLFIYDFLLPRNSHNPHCDILIDMYLFSEPPTYKTILKQSLTDGYSTKKLANKYKIKTSVLTEILKKLTNKMKKDKVLNNFIKDFI